MRTITLIACLLAAVIASAQFTEPGFYRVHNVGTDRYICIKGTRYNKTSNPDAFWPCIKMLSDSDQMADPGSIVYIPEMGETSLCAQGVSTYSLTGLMLRIDTATVREGGKPTYVARTQYGNFPCIFRDYGNGLTAGFLEAPQSRWWVEPVNAGSIDTSYLAVKPACETVADAHGWYWSSMCCDFSFVLPDGGGIEGAYTIRDINCEEDGFYHAQPIKVYGMGDTVPAATPVLLRCKTPYASGNKIVPVFPIANRTSMPITSDMLMGNYFSSFINHAHMTDYSVTQEYVPSQATMAAPEHMALGVNAEGRLGFFPQADGTYMAANSAWLSVNFKENDLPELAGVYLDVPQVEEPVIEPEVVMGDTNGDGVTNIKDVTNLINYLLLQGSGSSRDITINVEAADMNGDGKLTIRDVTLLIEHILSGEEESAQ